MLWVQILPKSDLGWIKIEGIPNAGQVMGPYDEQRGSRLNKGKLG
jgi:hypothetical protein